MPRTNGWFTPIPTPWFDIPLHHCPRAPHTPPARALLPDPAVDYGGTGRMVPVTLFFRQFRPLPLQFPHSVLFHFPVIPRGLWHSAAWWWALWCHSTTLTHLPCLHSALLITALPPAQQFYIHHYWG